MAEEEKLQQRFERLIVEVKRPWQDRYIMYLGIIVLDHDQKDVAEYMDCSPTTVSNWTNKHNYRKEKATLESEGAICVRCEENPTPTPPANDVCNECIDYVREQDSEFSTGRNFSQSVQEASV